MFKKITNYLPIFLFLFAFLILSIKAKYLSVSSSEEIIIQNSGSFKEAIAASRHYITAPFIYVLTTAFYFISKNIYVLRLPEILAGSAIILLFYYLVLYLPAKGWSASGGKLKWPLFFSLIPLLFLALVNFSLKIDPTIFLFLFSLLSFYYGYRIFIDKENPNFFQIALLCTSFVVLPMISFYSLYHLAILDISLIIFIFLVSKTKLFSLIYLVFLNLFSAIFFIPFGDIATIFFRDIFGLPPKIFDPNKLIFVFPLIFIVVLLVYLLNRFLKGFFGFILIYLILFLIFLFLIPPIRPFFQPLLHVLILPLYLLLSSGINKFIRVKNK